MIFSKLFGFISHFAHLKSPENFTFELFFAWKISIILDERKNKHFSRVSYFKQKFEVCDQSRYILIILLLPTAIQFNLWSFQRKYLIPGFLWKKKKINKYFKVF